MISKREIIFAGGLLAICIYSLTLIVPEARYALYATTPICLFLWIIVGTPNLQHSNKSFAFLLIIIMCLISAAIRTDIQALKDAAIVISGVSPFLFGKPNQKHLKIYASIIASSCLLAIILSGNLAQAQLSLIDSKSTAEFSPICYGASILLLHCYFQKNWKLTLLFLIIVLLTAKRVALLALTLIFMANLAPALLERTARSWKLVIALNLTAALVFYFITTTIFENISYRYFGVSPSYLTMGRSTLYSGFIGSCNDLCWIFGNGLASSYELLIDRIGGDIQSYSDRIYVHNDVVRLFFELGPPLTLAFFFLLYTATRFTKRRFYIALFYNITMIFDNTLLYSFTTFSLLLTLSYNDEKPQDKAPTEKKLQPLLLRKGF